MNTSIENAIDQVSEVTPSLIVSAVLTAGPLVIVGSFGNICVMITIIRKKSLRTTSNYFTFGLMFFSLLNVVFSYPMHVLTDLFFFTQQPACYLVGSLILCVSIQMVLCLLVLTIERYITIIRPLKADDTLTSRRVVLLFGCIAAYSMLVSFGVGGLTWIGKNDLWQQTRRCNFIFVVPSTKAMLFIVSHHLIVIPIMLVIYSHIFITVRRHIHAISAIQRPATSSEVAQATVGASSMRNDTIRRCHLNQSTNRLGDGPRRHTNRRITQEAKSALRLFCVVAAYITNWVPVIVFIMTGVVSENNKSPYVYVIMHMFLYGSVIFDSYIYGFGNRMIRKEVKAMLLPRLVTTLSDDEGNTVNFVNMKRTKQGLTEDGED